MSTTFNGKLTGKNILFRPPPGTDVVTGTVGPYCKRGDIGYMLVRTEKVPAGTWHPCAGVAILEVLEGQPAIAGASAPEGAPAATAAPPPEPEQAAPAGPPPRSSTHARLRAANKGGQRQGVDHGANAATEADFVQGQEEFRQPK